jgi:2-phosphosulfolactate phosphatase
MYFDQREYEVRFEWGLAGVQALAPVSDVVVIVDVLSFTTCVDIVVGNGGFVLPYRGPADSLAEFAAANEALYADCKRGGQGAYSLSPASLMTIPAGTRLVLPSPNGSTLSLAAEGVATLAGCLRNAQAVAEKAGQLGRRISVIAAGERWRSDGSLRPSLEDLVGAGAILAYLAGSRSPEAETAVATFHSVQSNLLDTLLRCGSGKELVGRGFEPDIHLAAQLNVSRAAPMLVDAAYRDA